MRFLMYCSYKVYGFGFFRKETDFYMYDFGFYLIPFVE